MNEDIKIDEKVTQYEDGVYRWIYELNPKKNNTIANTVFIAVGLSILVPLIILFIVFAINGQFMAAVKDMLPIFLLVGLVVTIITVIAYHGVNAYYGGSYTYVYEMDDEKISMRFYDDDAKKSENIGKASLLIGSLTRNLGLVGNGMYMAGNYGGESFFNKVYKVRTNPEKDLITITSFMLVNMIFVRSEDYQFVLDFINRHIADKKTQEIL